MDGLSSEATGTLANIQPDELASQCAAILRAAGVNDRVGAAVARSITRAEARGQSSHGVTRLPTYVKRIRAGLINANATPLVVKATPATAVMDAQGGFGHFVGLEAMSLAVEKATQVGIGAVAVRNSTHFGIAGPFAELAADRGCIGIATSNGPAWMAPSGTSTAVLGTNPIAVAVPGPQRTCFILDMATSVAALGKILALRAAGEAIPEGWALSSKGEPTTDASTAAEGLLLPLGGHKGFGLALVLEVLSAILSGARVGQNAGSMYRTWTEKEGLGHFFLAISVDAFRPREDYEQGLADLANQVRSAQVIADGNEIFLPGEVEARNERNASQNGIRLSVPMQAALVDALEAAGSDEQPSPNGE